MEYSKDRVKKIATAGSSGATKLLSAARGGSTDALADFVTWSLYKKLVDDGLSHDEAIDGVHTLIQIVDINLKVISG